MKCFLALFLLLFPLSASAQQVSPNSSISQLPQATLPLTPSTIIPVVENGVTSQATLSSLSSPLLGGLTTNSVVGALGVVTPTNLPLPSCNTGSSALTWTTGVGFGCNSIGNPVWPASGAIVVSNGTNGPAGIVEVDGECALGSGGVWTTGACGGGSGITALTGDVSATGTGSVVATLQNTSTARSDLGLGSLATLSSVSATYSGDATGNGSLPGTISMTVPELHGNTLTNTDWCTTNGTIINCTVTPITNNNQLTNGSNYISANQTITLTGDATATGTTAIPVVLTNSATARSDLGLGTIATQNANALTATGTFNGAANITSGNAIFTTATVTNLTVLSATSGGTQCLQASSAGLVSGTGTGCGSGGGGSGTVSSGNTGQLPLYTSTGTTVSPVTVSGDVAISVSGVTTLQNTATARSDLGLGSLATLSSVSATFSGDATGSGSFAGTVALTLTNSATARTDLGLGTSATVNTGTSGATIPLLNGANTWSGTQTLSAVNLATDTTTGMIIATATAQKLGFYGVAGIAQPTGDIKTALTNLGLIGSPTISGADITTGAINNIAVGTTTAAAGSFTALTASGASTINLLTATGTFYGAATITSGNLIVTTATATNFYGNLTGNLSATTATATTFNGNIVGTTATLTTGNITNIVGTTATYTTFNGNLVGTTATLSGAANVAGLITTTSTHTGISNFGSGMMVNVLVYTSTATIALTTSNYFLCVNKTVGAATSVTLPAATGTGQLFIIKDCKGDANSNNITVTPTAGNIDGAGTAVINTAYGVAGFIWNGTNWNLE